MAWANDNKTLFYVTKDKLDRPFKVCHYLPQSSSGKLHGMQQSADSHVLMHVCLTIPSVDIQFYLLQIWRHTIGSGEEDALVYHETDDQFYIGIGLTRSKKFLYISAGGAGSTTH